MKTAATPPPPPLALTDRLAQYIRYAESKRLLNRIVSAQAEQKFKTLALLSAHPKEGRTFLSAIIALGYASLLGKRVLIVDTVSQQDDGSLALRSIFGEKRQEHNLFMIDVMTAEDLAKSEHKPQGDFFLPQAVRAVADPYEIILYDTTAMDRANKNNLDPVIIAKHADTSLLILSKNCLGRDPAERIREEVRLWEIRLLGTVFNYGQKS